ncbi:MAG: sulfatase-like hydrolase/transferase [Lentisphaeria bacterium]|nr:sulfatase-like hydrolase/transferase [Lentisphaeria bacterium]
MRIIYFDLDALNPDHLSCYGYHRETSPNIDQIAKEGTRFNNMYTSDAPCLPSRTALYTGQFGIHSGVVGHGGTAADLRSQGLSRRFNDRLEYGGTAGFMQGALGMKTAMVSPFGQRHSAWHFYAGFNDIINSGKGGMDDISDVTPDVLGWLERNKDEEDFYLHINYWDIHTPYRYPEKYGNQFADEPLPEWLTEETLEKHKKTVGPHGALEISMYNGDEDKRFPFHPGALTDMDQLRRMIDGYDTSIKLVDEELGKIFQWLKDHDMYEDTAIIISADHGENMGDLAIYGEHGTADNGTCRIPFIAKWPKCQTDAVDDGFHYNVDMAPTIAEAAGKTEVPAFWDGESFFKTLQDGTDTGREELIVSQCAHVCQRGVRFDDYMYIRTYHCGFRLHPQEQLYNLKEDPYEQNDIAAENPELCKEANWRLSNWHDTAMQKSDYATDPMWTVIQEGGPEHAKTAHLPDYLKHLRNTGRAEGAKLLEEKYAVDLAHLENPPPMELAKPTLNWKKKQI